MVRETPCRWLEADLSGLVVSRDGTLAAYSSNETGLREVYVRSFPEAGGHTQVSEGGGEYPVWSLDGNTVYYWLQLTVPGGGSAFVAARIQRDPTPVVLSRDTLFTGDYVLSVSDLHPDGNRLVAAERVTPATGLDASGSEPERFIVVTNWFEELRERMGN